MNCWQKQIHLFAYKEGRYWIGKDKAVAKFKKRSWRTFRDDKEGEVWEASETQDNGGWVVEVRSEDCKESVNKTIDTLIIEVGKRMKTEKMEYYLICLFAGDSWWEWIACIRKQG